MLTRALNSLVLLRIGGFRLAHGGGRDGFVPLLIGLAIIGIADLGALAFEPAGAGKGPAADGLELTCAAPARTN